MGFVYRINLPNGEFYIGCTSRPLKKRLMEHLSLEEEAKWNVKLFDSGYNLRQLIDNTQILFDGCGFRQKELMYIYDSRESDKMLNSLISRIDPRDLEPIPDDQKKFKIDRSDGVHIHIRLSESECEVLDRQRKRECRNRSQQIRELIKKEERSKDDGR